MHWRTFSASPYLEFGLGGPRSVWPDPSFLPERPLQRDVGSAIGDDDNHDTAHVPAGLRVDPDTDGLKGKEEVLEICERDKCKEKSFNFLRARALLIRRLVQGLCSPLLESGSREPVSNRTTPSTSKGIG